MNILIDKDNCLPKMFRSVKEESFIFSLLIILFLASFPCFGKPANIKPSIDQISYSMLDEINGKRFK